MLLDTSGLYCYFDKDDRLHEQAVKHRVKPHQNSGFCRSNFNLTLDRDYLDNKNPLSQRSKFIKTPKRQILFDL